MEEFEFANHKGFYLIIQPGVTHYCYNSLGFNFWIFYGMKFKVSHILYLICYFLFSIFFWKILTLSLVSHHFKLL